MEHKLLINQSRGGEKMKKRFCCWSSHGISQTKMYVHIQACFPFSYIPFSTASSGDDMQNINKSPEAATVFLELAPCPLGVSLTLSHPLGELTSGLCSLMWRDIFIVQIKLAILMITQGTAHLPPQSLWHALSGVRRLSQGEQLFWIWPRALTTLKGRPTAFMESYKRGPSPKQWALLTNPEEQRLFES